ncbi:MAG: hypothetical protein Q8N81_07820 [bacterium]|nr:hypothetical protein [bacterium]
MTPQHKSLAAGRWFHLSLAEQLGNAGSEYSRALNWKSRDEGKFNSATARFFELMDLTLADPRWKGAARRELARVREHSAEIFHGEATASKTFQKYFDQFAILARTTK